MDREEFFDHLYSPLVAKAYSELENYYTKKMTDDGQYVVVYCTSNGLYFPNTKRNFLETVYEKNRFEWNDKKYDLPKTYKNIYVRDVFKQWYVKGINKDICDIDAIVEFIADIIKEKKLIVIGSSSGGYLATIIGCKLSASHVFSFSGQFDLDLALIDKDLLVIEQGKLNNKYHNIVSLIKDSNCDIFYFSSKDSKEDIKQRELVKDISNVYVFVFPGDIHGVPLKNFELRKLIIQDKEKLLLFHDRYKGKVINSFDFDLKLLGIKGIIHMYLDVLHRKFLKYLNKFRKK